MLVQDMAKVRRVASKPDRILRVPLCSLWLNVILAAEDTETHWQYARHRWRENNLDKFPDLHSARLVLSNVTDASIR